MTLLSGSTRFLSRIGAVPSRDCMPRYRGMFGSQSRKGESPWSAQRDMFIKEDLVSAMLRAGQVAAQFDQQAESLNVEAWYHVGLAILVKPLVLHG